MTITSFPRPWHEPAPDYDPTDVTPPELRAAASARGSAASWIVDVTDDPRTIDWGPRQREALVSFDVVDGVPLNPAGRTGRTGRMLGAWGEVKAADPIPMTWVDGVPHVLLIQRRDCGEWATPGGMWDAGETWDRAALRELREETGVDASGAKLHPLPAVYVEDRRNTDLAWICTTPAVIALPTPVEPCAGDDAAAAAWWPMRDMGALMGALYCHGGALYRAHIPLLERALTVWRA